MVGIAPLAGPVAALRSFVRRHGIAYPTLVDPGGKVARQYGLQTYPLSVLIDRQGSIRWIHRGFRTGEQRSLEAQVRRALAG